MTLLIGPYLNPTDAARLVRWQAFLAGLATGMLLGWAGSVTAVALIQHGGSPL